MGRMWKERMNWILTPEVESQLAHGLPASGCSQNGCICKINETPFYKL
jgi:hypothetical protein